MNGTGCPSLSKGAPGLPGSLPPPGHKHSPELVHHPHQHEERVLADTLLECVGKGRELLVCGVWVKESHSHTGRAGGDYLVPAATDRALMRRGPGSEAPAPRSYARRTASTALPSGLPGPPSFPWDLLRRCRPSGWASGGKRWPQSACPEHPLHGTGRGVWPTAASCTLAPSSLPVLSGASDTPSPQQPRTQPPPVPPQGHGFCLEEQTFAIPSCSPSTLQALPGSPCRSPGTHECSRRSLTALAPEPAAQGSLGSCAQDLGAATSPRMPAAATQGRCRDWSSGAWGHGVAPRPLSCLRLSKAASRVT